ncbi:TPA: hypothetical protein ACVBCY_001817 [Aeromonas hydrophila]
MATFLPGHGFLVQVLAMTPGYYSQDLDVAISTSPKWFENFGVTSDLGLFYHVMNPGGVFTTPLLSKTITLNQIKDFVIKVTCHNNNWTPDYCDFDLEFLDAGGAVLGAIRNRYSKSLSQGLSYGPSLTSLTLTGSVGTYPQTYGTLSFTAGAIVYTSDTWDGSVVGRNNSFSIPCNTANIASLRFTNVRAQSNYTNNNSSGAKVQFSILSAPAGFSGDFSGLTAAQYTALNPDLYLPSGAAIGHQEGVGLTASGTAPSYVLSRGVLPGQTGVLLDSNNQVMARLSYIGGIASLTVDGVTTSVPSTSAALCLTALNGQVIAYDIQGVVVKSERFIATGLITMVTLRPWIEVQPGESLSTIWTQIYPLDAQLTYDYKRQPINPIPANQEPRALFEPQDVAWRGSPPLFAGPVQVQKLTSFPMIKGRDYFWLRDGSQSVQQGYIESTVTIDGEGVARRVLCFTQDGDLVAETMSRASDGKYRFDLLWLNRRYMLVAQDDPAFGPADYNAVAADYQLPTPYAPGEGVGLA